jgi:hypothetical protein
LTGPGRPRLTILLGVALLLFAGTGCGADVPPYAPCEGGDECEAPSDGCYDVTVQREDGSSARAAFCSAGCASHEDCPDDGACLALDAEPDVPLCWQRCERTSDCASPLLCTGVTGAAGVAQVCMP